MVENEAEAIVSSGRLGSGDMKSCARRSDESRARRKAAYKQRQRARKASINGSQNKTEVDVAQEAEETE